MSMRKGLLEGARNTHEMQVDVGRPCDDDVDAPSAIDAVNAKVERLRRLLSVITESAVVTADRILGSMPEGDESGQARPVLSGSLPRLEDSIDLAIRDAERLHHQVLRLSDV